jgi:hypothetical protein
MEAQDQRGGPGRPKSETHKAKLRDAARDYHSRVREALGMQYATFPKTLDGLREIGNALVADIADYYGGRQRFTAAELQARRNCLMSDFMNWTNGFAFIKPELKEFASLGVLLATAHKIELLREQRDVQKALGELRRERARDGHGATT